MWFSSGERSAIVTGNCCRRECRRRHLHDGTQLPSVDAMDAKELVRTAVRQWGKARKPDYFVAQLPSHR